MQQGKVNNAIYKTTINIEASIIKQVVWYFVNIVFFKNSFNVFSALKVFLLRLFGAKIGEGVVIKPAVNIKYPWKLSVGDHSWIGEKVWIDNLAHVSIGNNVCLSQGAMLLTGNHNYKKRGFDLMIKPIILEDGVWIGTCAIVCNGITCSSHSMLSVGSIATKDMEAYGIYKGNTAVKVSLRIIE